ncbi:MAG: BTAD domain-containing putative transcriptional regulator [Trueperaceae bacterium]
MPLLDIRLLGDFRVAWGDEPANELVSSRARSLLAYLLLHGETPQSRRRLAFLFWPDSSEAQAHTNLRRELHQLRKALPQVEGSLEIHTRTLAWRADDQFSLDVAQFETELERATEAARPEQRRDALMRAVDLYQGDLLPDNYEEWVGAERERLRGLYGVALEKLVGELEAERRYSEALAYGRRLLQHDPVQERSYRTLMRLYALNGDPAGSMAVYRQCASVLAEQFDVTPGFETESLYRQLGRSEAEAAVPPPQQAGAEPLVGRPVEWQELLARWREASKLGARVVVAQGEAGVGKTRLAEELLDWAQRQGFVTARARCYRAEGRLAFAPVAEWFRSPPVAEALARLDHVWLGEVARVLPELLAEAPSPDNFPNLHESWQRRRLFEGLSRAALGCPQPLLLLLDDAQWCDRETLEWLHHLLRFDPDARFLVILTVRSEERADNPPLDTLLLELDQLERISEITVGPLDETATAELAGLVIGRRVEQDEARDLFEASEGHPLFVVEMARVGLSTGPWQETSEVIRRGKLPPKVQAVITARLAQLSPVARSLARLAAAVGRNFTFEQLQAAADLDETTLVTALDELWRRKIVREHDRDGFDFSHDRIREVAYGELGPAQRRFLHRRLAQALAQLHSEDIDMASSQIAAHYEQAGLVARAAHFYERAARVARRVAASREAVRLLRRGLTLLQQLPPSHERDRLELSLQYSLSAPLNLSLGYASPELEASLERVRLLGERLEQPKAVIGSLVGLFGVNFVQGNSLKARLMGEEAVTRAEHQPELLAESHFALGGALFSLGRFDAAHHHFERSESAGNPSGSGSLVFGADLAVLRQSYQAHTLWHLGSIDQARLVAERAVSRAQALDDPYNLALANAYAALTRQFLGDRSGALACADTVRTLCDRYEYAYYGAWGDMIRGWAIAQGGDVDTGLAEIGAALESLRSAGALARRPYYLSLQATVLTAGRPNEALQVLSAALDQSARCSEVWWDAELLRLRGELELTVGGGASRAESTLRAARRVAGEQGSKTLELRATSSLSRLLASQGRKEEARADLTAIVAKFTEGSDSEDLRRAQLVLASLA